MKISTITERIIYDVWNLGYALIGPPTTLIAIGFVMYVHNKVLYLFFGGICLGYIIYYMYLFFTNAAEKSTEAQINGDPGPTNDFYWMSIAILVIYLFLSVVGFMNPEVVGQYRDYGARKIKSTHKTLKRGHY